MADSPVWDWNDAGDSDAPENSVKVDRGRTETTKFFSDRRRDETAKCPAMDSSSTPTFLGFFAVEVLFLLPAMVFVPLLLEWLIPGWISSRGLLIEDFNTRTVAWEETERVLAGLATGQATDVRLAPLNPLYPLQSPVTLVNSHSSSGDDADADSLSSLGDLSPIRAWTPYFFRGSVAYPAGAFANMPTLNNITNVTKEFRDAEFVLNVTVSTVLNGSMWFAGIFSAEIFSPRTRYTHYRTTTVCALVDFGHLRKSPPPEGTELDIQRCHCLGGEVFGSHVWKRSAFPKTMDAAIAVRGGDMAEVVFEIRDTHDPADVVCQVSGGHSFGTDRRIFAAALTFIAPIVLLLICVPQVVCLVYWGCYLCKKKKRTTMWDLDYTRQDTKRRAGDDFRASSARLPAATGIVRPNE